MTITLTLDAMSITFVSALTSVILQMAFVASNTDASVFRRPWLVAAVVFINLGLAAGWGIRLYHGYSS